MGHEKKKVAILGASGHIAKGLIEHLGSRCELFTYSRTEGNLRLFSALPYDAVINCIGVREKLWAEPGEIFRITEEWDNKVLDYLDWQPEALYISFSSGAAYGGAFSDPVYHQTPARFDINALGKQAFYGIAKLNAEAKHRALEHLNIVDLRVYSYFSEHQRPGCRCLMNGIMESILSGREMATSPDDILRDYIHPLDLARLVSCCIELHDLNAAFDAYSRRPVGKFELLEFFKAAYGLKYRIDEQYPETSPTGTKPHYYSLNTAAEEIGYRPLYSSMNAIREAAGRLLLRSVNSVGCEA